MFVKCHCLPVRIKLQILVLISDKEKVRLAWVYKFLLLKLCSYHTLILHTQYYVYQIKNKQNWLSKIIVFRLAKWLSKFTCCDEEAEPDLLPSNKWWENISCRNTDNERNTMSWKRCTPYFAFCLHCTRKGKSTVLSNYKIHLFHGRGMDGPGWNDN